MKNDFHRNAIALYSVSLCVLVVVQIIPHMTGHPWGKEGAYVIHVFAGSVAVFALVHCVVGMRQQIRFQILWRRRWKNLLNEQDYILRHAEDIYRQQGYVNRGSFGLGHIALQFGVKEHNPRVEDALAGLVEKGKLVSLSDPNGTRYVLPEKRQFEIIRANDLPNRWQERGEIFLPNDPVVGEIARVKRAVKPNWKKIFNS